MIAGLDPSALAELALFFFFLDDDDAESESEPDDFLRLDDVDLDELLELRLCFELERSGSR